MHQNILFATISDMVKVRIFILFLIISLCATTVFAATRNSYTKYSKHIMPVEFDPYFIDNFSTCTPHWYVDWTGTYKYIIEGRDSTMNNMCKYKTQYNPWLTKNKNEWQDYKQCYFSDIQLNELTVALKESSNLVSTYGVGWYKVTGTKLEFLLSSYEYNGACKLIKSPVVHIVK